MYLGGFKVKLSNTFGTTRTNVFFEMEVVSICSEKLYKLNHIY